MGVKDFLGHHGSHPHTQVARHIKVTHEESPYFTVVCQKPLVSKVAPGMEATYNIVFTPDEKKVVFAIDSFPVPVDSDSLPIPVDWE